MKELQHLLNKLNKVTAYHRHGNKIPVNALDELSNAQIEYEKATQVQAGVSQENGGQDGDFCNCPENEILDFVRSCGNCGKRFK